MGLKVVAVMCLGKNPLALSTL